ncbi:MAG: PEP-CTERM sorting domain-containing protein [Planctomycetota bacterium]
MKCIASALASTVLIHSASASLLIGVDFNRDTSLTSQFITSGAAAVGQAGDQWNNLVVGNNWGGTVTTSASLDLRGINGSNPLAAISLVDTTGAASGIGLELGYFSGNTGQTINSGRRFADTVDRALFPADASLMRDYLFYPGSSNDNDEFRGVLSGLTSGTTYALYVYAAGNTFGAGSTVGLGESAFQTGGSATGPVLATTAEYQFENPNQAYEEGLNYVRFEFTPTGTTESFYVKGADGAFLNGIQLQELQVIPEPGTLVLLGIGSALIAGRRRRA